MDKHNDFGITDLDLLSEWKKRFADLLVTVDESFPKTRVKIFHNSVLRVTEEFLTAPVISELNTAGMNLAHKAGWQVVDLAGLVQNFETRDKYLRDGHHPHAFVMHALFDIYMSKAAHLLRKVLPT